MSSKLKLKILGPDKTVFSNSEVDCVSLPTSKGIVSIYPNHATLISLIQTGEIEIEFENEKVFLAVSGGLLKVLPDNQVEILVDTAERAEEIDLERAEMARARAEKLLEQQKDNTHLDELEIMQIQAKIERNVARINLGKRTKTRTFSTSDIPTED